MGNYEPFSCRIIPLKENCINNTSPITITYKGECITHTGNDWARKLGLPKCRINGIRWKYGEGVAKSFIVDSLNGETPILPDNRSKCGKTQRSPYVITIGDESRRASEWERIYGLPRCKISSIKLRYGEEEAIKYVKALVDQKVHILPDKRINNGRVAKNTLSCSIAIPA